MTPATITFILGIFFGFCGALFAQVPFDTRNPDKIVIKVLLASAMILILYIATSYL